MTWISSYYYDSGIFSNSNSWIFSGSSLKVDSANLLDYPSLTYTNSIKKFSSRKNYQYVTKVEDFYTTGTSFSVASTWSDSFKYDNYSYSDAFGSHYATATPAYPGNGYLHFYSSPTVDISSNNYAIYKANNKFGSYISPTEGLMDLKVNEIDFNIQGYSFYRLFDTYASPNFLYDTLGWAYYSDTNSYVWFDSSTSIYYPCGPKSYYVTNNVPSSDFRKNNNLSKLITYPFFNLSFVYQRAEGGSNDGISVYLSPELPNSSGSEFSLPSGGVLIASITQSEVGAQFYGLQGNQYLIIVANTGLTSSATYSSLILSNIKVEGGYHPDNNRQYLLTDSSVYSDPTILSPIGLTAASYTTYIGTGNTINATQSLNVTQLFSKIGNGTFKAGIWENGVWNSGWRYDENVYEFYEVGKYYDHTKGKNWRFVISGPASSASKFSIGDKISIGNIVAIDINEDRKLIKSYFTIIGVNYSNTTTSAASNYIIVELINSFPLRRIEKDSPNHRIFVTKNVWLSGAFLNGYFKGIWNYGLFKGYPLITEMFESHWVDGIFDGGHFNSTQLGMTFSDTVYSSITIDLRPQSKVGLTFSTPHRLNVGDTIVIDKDNKSINPSYDGETKVLEVPNEYQIVTNINWGSNSTMEGGSIYTEISNGLIQNFDFRSHNISTVTSVNSLDSDTVFIYNSWIDVNYNPYSAVNINKPQTLIDSLSRKSYSDNNLYGYPTNDVLSSTSKFRDSFALTEKSYKLGTKYKIFNDYIGESSKFEDYFGPTGPDAQLFIDQGWTFSKSSDPLNGGIAFSRTIDTGIDPIVGKELKVEVYGSDGSGGVLDIKTPAHYIRNRTTSEVEKQRYTIAEFDLLTYSVTSDYYFTVGTGVTILEPVINFNNINRISRGGSTNYATYLPIYQNIDHLSTPNTKKYEYFYGKRNLSMYFRGSGDGGENPSTFIIDNLNFLEIDMIPFFQYFTEGSINRSVQIPYQGIAPFIDYTNSNFSFLDNISIGFDSVSVVSSSLPVSGVGIPIGVGIVETILTPGESLPPKGGGLYEEIIP